MSDDEQLTAIYKNWMSDATFRAEFQANPKAVLLKDFGIEVPTDVSIQVHAPSSIKELHLLMPVAVTTSDVQLSAINDGGVTIACTTSVPGGTCWNTPNCPTKTTCPGSAC